MNKKKILIVSSVFYPRISPRSFRATELAKEFSRQGHDVKVLTNVRDFDYTEFSKTYNLQIEDFVKGKWKELNGKNIVVRALRYILKYFFLFPDIQLSFLLKKYLISTPGCDLLISIAVPYPIHWGVALAKNENINICNVWVADCGDPFMGNKEQKIGHPFYFHFIENWFCKKPDFLTVPIKEAINAYPSFCRNKIKVIPQGFNFDEVNVLCEKEENIYPVFAYAGSLSKGIRDPGQFFEYLSLKSDIEFKFIIYTRSISVVEPFKNILGKKLEIREYIPREQLLVELCKMNFLVNFENTNTVQSPSKLIDYALTGKPILSITSNNLNTSVVDEFLVKNYSNKTYVTCLEQYDIKNVTKQFILLIK